MSGEEEFGFAGDAFFEFYIFEDGFYDEVAVFEVCDFIGGGNAVEDGFGLGGGEFTLLAEVV